MTYGKKLVAFKIEKYTRACAQRLQKDMLEANNAANKNSLADSLAIEALNEHRTFPRLIAVVIEESSRSDISAFFTTRDFALYKFWQIFLARGLFYTTLHNAHTVDSGDSGDIAHSADIVPHGAVPYFTSMMRFEDSTEQRNFRNHTLKDGAMILGHMADEWITVHGDLGVEPEFFRRKILEEGGEDGELLSALSVAIPPFFGEAPPATEEEWGSLEKSLRFLLKARKGLRTPAHA